MNINSTALYLAAALLVLVALAHSFLGERYLLMRLFKRHDLPKIMGSTTFAARTLRFAWHLTSVAWLGFALLLVLLAWGVAAAQAIGVVVAATFGVHGAVALLASRGKHLSWIFFGAIAALTLYATRHA